MSAKGPLQPTSPKSSKTSDKKAKSGFRTHRSDFNALDFGLEVEKSAAEWFLIHHPTSQLLARNYRCKSGELDLVFEEKVYSDVDGPEKAERGVELVFVEVRARCEGSWVSAVESIDLRKQKKLRRVIEHFLAQYRGRAHSARFDVLAWDGKHWTHVPNAMQG